MCIQWTCVLYYVVITRQSNPLILQFNSLCNEFRVSGQCLYTIQQAKWYILIMPKHLLVIDHLLTTIKAIGLHQLILIYYWQICFPLFCPKKFKCQWPGWLVVCPPPLGLSFYPPLPPPSLPLSNEFCVDKILTIDILLRLFIFLYFLEIHLGFPNHPHSLSLMVACA